MRLSSWLIILRRDESQAFRRILNSPVGRPARTAIMFDRRERERRVLRLEVGIERRLRERRAKPNAMWHTHRFIVVETAQLPTEAIQIEAIAS